MTITDYSRLIGKWVQVTVNGGDGWATKTKGTLTKANLTPPDIWEIEVRHHDQWDSGFRTKAYEKDLSIVLLGERQLPTTPGTVVRVGDHIYVRWQSGWLRIDLEDGVIWDHDAEEVDVVRLWRENGIEWQLLVPAPDEPQLVIDAGHYKWLRHPDGLYSLYNPHEDEENVGRTLADIQETFGPLTLPDGSPL